MLPNHFIVCFGAQRGGTTWLYEQLQTHPGTNFPPRKEIRYFDPIYVKNIQFDVLQLKRIRGFQLKLGALLKNDGSLLNNAYARVLNWYARYTIITESEYNDNWYESLFAECDPEKVTGDFSPSYSLLPEPGVAHLYRLLPEARLVFMMRNPVDRIWSGSTYALRRREDMSAEERLREIRKLAASQMQKDFSDYRSTLERYMKFYDKDAICVVFHDDISENPMKLLKAVCKHAGLEFLEKYFPRVAKNTNRSPEVAVDDPLIRSLQKEYLPLLEWLSETYGGHAEKWLEQAKLNIR